MALLVLTAIGLAGVFLAEKRGLVAQGTFANLVGQVAKVRPPKQLTENPQQITNFIASETQNAAQDGEVLGASLSIEREEPPFTQKAFEYGRYTYCQAVVDDYHQRFGNSTPLDSANGTSE